MPSLNLDFLNLLKSDYKNYKIFIETGTGYCDTIIEMVKYFDELYSIEISKVLHERALEKHSNDKINFILADSAVYLNELLPELNDNVIIFLDAHYSFGETGHNGKQVPLLEELEIINNKLSKEAIIIIDDMRLTDKKKKRKEWCDINDKIILSKIDKNRIKNYYYLSSELHEKDRFVIEMNEK